MTSRDELSDLLHLTGAIESVRHHNAEDGWTVARLRVTEGSGEGECCTCVGCLAEAREGMEVKLWGQWVVHPTYGDQFKFSRYALATPMTAPAIARFLSGGAVSGVGPKLAELLVGHFGDETLHVLDDAPERLREVPGIGKKKAATILEGWRKAKASDTQGVLMRLQGMSLSAALAIRIFRHYGEGAVAAVEHNPYQLAMEVEGHRVQDRRPYRPSAGPAAQFSLPPDRRPRLHARSGRPAGPLFLAHRQALRLRGPVAGMRRS